MSPDYAAVLSAIRPNSLWAMTDNDYATLAWHSEDPKPTKKTLDDAWPQVQADRAWTSVRAKRDALLAASDWTMMADAPLSDLERGLAGTYRQQLRDVPQDNDDPNNIAWPVAPWDAP